MKKSKFSESQIVAILAEGEAGVPVAQTHDTAIAATTAEPAFYRLADLIRITALSRSTIYRRIAAGEFPPPVSLGRRATGWRREALQAWIGDPAGFRALTTCDVLHSASGARVRYVASAPARSRLRRR